MDRYEDTNSMMKIALGKEGKFLSGRSRAQEIVKEFDADLLKKEEVEISFEKVESCSQSFISELIFRLKEVGVQPGRVKATAISDPEKEKRFKSELKRLSMT